MPRIELKFGERQIAEFWFDSFRFGRTKAKNVPAQPRADLEVGRTRFD